MKTMKKVLCVLLVVLMCVTSAPIGGFVGLELPQWNLKASALASTGQCGDDVYWNFDSSTGELVISGSGSMTNYSVTGGGSPFSMNRAIKNVVVKNGVTSVGVGAFTNCTALTNLILSEDITNIGACAFEDCSIKSITLSCNVKTIGSGAFRGCNLNTITIPLSVELIGDYAFNSCNQLTNIIVDNNNKNYSSDAYGVLFDKNKTKIIQYPIGNDSTQYTIPNSVINIGGNAFYGCRKLEKINLPNSVTNIGYQSFRGCSKLSNVSLGNSLTTIGTSAFQDCNSLTKITLPSSLIEIEGGAFSGCGFTNITIPNSVTNIEDSAFSKCNKLVSVTIPDSVISVGLFGTAFWGCKNLTNIIVDANNNKYSSDMLGTLFDKEKTKLIQYPIGNERTSYTIPDGVTDITQRSFYDCDNLVCITIPSSINKIDYDAFVSCNNITDVYFQGTKKQWNSITICSGNESLLNATIHFWNEDEPENGNCEITFVDGTEYTIYAGETILRSGDDNSFRHMSLDAKLYSETLTTMDITWSCSDESILQILATSGYKNTIDQCYDLSAGLKALKPGEVTVTATASDGTSESCTIKVLGNNAFFEVESTNSSNSIPVGEIIPLQVALFVNGKQTTEEKKYNLAFDNPDIFSVESSSTRENIKGAFFDIKLKAEDVGVTNLTISDSKTGAYITILLTVNEKMNVYYFDKVPKVRYQNDRLTNFYNYNGICIDSFHYIRSGDIYKVSMNAYNKRHHYGVAVAYDEKGQIYDFDLIEPFKECKTTFSETLLETLYAAYDLGKLFGDKYYYTGESITKHTSVNLDVPKDGYVIITNNCAENELAYIVNSINYLVNSSFATLSIGMATISAIDQNSIIKELSEQIVKEIIESGLTDTVKSFGATIAKNISYKEISVYVNDFAEAMKKLDIDIVKIITETLNAEFGISIVESVVWNLLPTGAIIQYLFAMNDAGNSILQANDFAKSSNAPQIVLYPPLNDDEAYTSNGVIVNPENGVSPEYVLHTYVVSPNSNIAIEADKVLNEVSDKYKIHNVTLYKNGIETQPNGKIKVMIPIPVEYNKNNIQIYWYKEDGTLTSMNATVEGDYAVFYTDHLSYYALIEKKHTHSYGDKDAKCSDCGFDRTDNCSCNCHKGGIKGFFFKFLLFFQKIFRTNKVCKCGINHY